MTASIIKARSAGGHKVHLKPEDSPAALCGSQAKWQTYLDLSAVAVSCEKCRLKHRDALRLQAGEHRP